ncbi:MAG: helix-hairpin-helix domain-containing protein [Chitinophagaceae bacterium]|nr:helix-hairpin-helix domain-containing protein [Chitinophagaceae bacterium]MCW5925828.1 helix-hairpin-helix domain-containing protein [Chitinophagaceae bacterium]
MKSALFLSFFVMILLPSAQGQEPSGIMEQQLEDLTEMMEDAETTDDSWWQQAEALAKNPLNLNVAGKQELEGLMVLTSMQIAGFLSYRKLMGNLISIYELQAVPGWDIATIERILPFVSIKTAVNIKEDISHRLRNGEHHIIARYSRLLKLPAGYLQRDSGRSYYTGDPSAAMLRYRYQYKNILQYGITAAKDAGEPFFRYPNRYGFDSYSFHYFSRHSGIIKTVAIGDYTINLGQGLIHWQSLAFGKGSAAMNVKRQSDILRPYNSAGYFYFNRGAATTLRKGKWETTLFTSVRKLDGNIITDDTKEIEVATSVKASGYRRTPAEIEDKHSLRQFSYGGNINYQSPAFKIGINMIRHHFDKYLQKENRLYNLYAISGTNWSNYSADYAYTFRNIHFSGETAIDKNGSVASINSLISSLHPNADFVLLYRNISGHYQAMYGNAFTVNANPTNEQGVYAGLSLKPKEGFQVNAYMDVYRFAWLKYRVDAPAGGQDYFVQVNYKPDKITEIYSRFRSRQNPVNKDNGTNALNEVITFSHRSWRTQVSHRINGHLTIRHRFEILWYHPENASKEKGFLAFFDLLYKPMGKPFSFNTRVQYFDSDSYSSRLYAYENDVLYYYAVPVFYDKGSRYYLNMQYKLGRSVSLWVKFAQTVYNQKNVIGSGLDTIEGNRKPEFRMLVSARL